MKKAHRLLMLTKRVDLLRIALERIRDIGYSSQAHRATETVLAHIRIAEEALCEDGGLNIEPHA